MTHLKIYSSTDLVIFLQKNKGITIRIDFEGRCTTRQPNEKEKRARFRLHFE